MPTTSLAATRTPADPTRCPASTTALNGDKLSWGEGFPDYYQSAARTIMPGSGFTSYYIDVTGPTVDFEALPGTASPLNEGAVAAMLWDFLDTANDGSDTVSHGQARIQKAFTDPGFQANAQCNMAPLSHGLEKLELSHRRRHRGHRGAERQHRQSLCRGRGDSRNC